MQPPRRVHALFAPRDGGPGIRSFARPTKWPTIWPTIWLTVWLTIWLAVPVAGLFPASPEGMAAR
ncbi:MAG: hypothetical protein OEW11_02680, partial [Nitrospirota bacterium]|nr:hypothetical protein [Nitrospirota bacterium]